MRSMFSDTWIVTDGARRGVGGRPAPAVTQSMLYAVGDADLGAKASKPTGTYVQGAYVYYYNAVTGAITIVRSPKSTRRTVLNKNTAAYKAVLRAILNGKAQLTRSKLPQVKRPTPRRKPEVQEDALVEELPETPPGLAVGGVQLWPPSPAVAIGGAAALVGLVLLVRR